MKLALLLLVAVSLRPVVQSCSAQLVLLPGKRVGITASEICMYRRQLLPRANIA